MEWRVTLVRTASMPSPDAAARHTGAGVARRQAHHERMRDERAREAAAGNAELPPEDDAVEMVSAAQLLDSVAEVGPNYTLLRSKETKAKRRKRQREDARAALDGHTVLSTGSRLEIFCDSERWYPATVMAREEDGDGRIVHEVEYDGYSDRRWWHMLDDERWRAVPEQAGAGAGGAAADGDGDAAMDYPQNTRYFADLADFGPAPNEPQTRVSAQSPENLMVSPGKQRGKRGCCREKRKGKETGCERKSLFMYPHTYPFLAPQPGGADVLRIRIMFLHSPKRPRDDCLANDFRRDDPALCDNPNRIPIVKLAKIYQGSASAA